MLINLSNHPSTQWTSKQIEAARQLSGDIVDYDFPSVSPLWDESMIKECGKSVFKDIMEKYGTHDMVIHLMGEFTLTYFLIELFSEAGIPCVASCSERITIDNGDGTKFSRFDFVQFRRYINK